MYQLTRPIRTSPDPFAQLARDFFGVPLPTARGTKTTHQPPRFDLVESEDAYILRADVPGLLEENLDVSVHEGVLTVGGSRDEQALDEGAGFLIRERTHGSFERRLRLPKNADAEQVSAKLDAGVLAISIAKKPELKARKIEIG